MKEDKLDQLRMMVSLLNEWLSSENFLSVRILLKLLMQRYLREEFFLFNSNINLKE